MTSQRKTNSKVILDSAWEYRDSIQDQDLEDPDEWEEEEEVEYVTLDIGSHLGAEILKPDEPNPIRNIQLAGLNSTTPFLRIGAQIFKGEHETLVGSEILLRQENNDVIQGGGGFKSTGGIYIPQNNPITTTSNRVRFHPVTLTESNSNSNSNEDNDPNSNSNSNSNPDLSGSLPPPPLSQLATTPTSTRAKAARGPGRGRNNKGEGSRPNARRILVPSQEEEEEDEEMGDDDGGEKEKEGTETVALGSGRGRGRGRVKPRRGSMGRRHRGERGRGQE